MKESTSSTSAPPVRRTNLRQKYLACFHRISMRFRSGLVQAAPLPLPASLLTTTVHRFATVDVGIVKHNDHVVAHCALFLDRPQQLAIMAQRTQDIDTLPVCTGLGTTAVTDWRPSILQPIRTESRFVEIQQIALARLRHALQRRHAAAGMFKRGGIALVLQARAATLVAKRRALHRPKLPTTLTRATISGSNPRPAAWTKATPTPSRSLRDDRQPGAVGLPTKYRRLKVCASAPAQRGRCRHLRMRAENWDATSIVAILRQDVRTVHREG